MLPEDKVEGWIAAKNYPMRELHTAAAAEGISTVMYPKEVGGTKSKDVFFELILVDELARVGGGVLGQLSIDSMAVPPLLHALDTCPIARQVVEDVVAGHATVALAISEPAAGSDVANIEATAERDGDSYLVNGSKKWITGGLTADYFTTLVRTGGPGFAGLSLLLIDARTPGIRVRRMETQFDSAHNTSFVTFDNVRVPANHLIGAEGAGALLILENFNHERFVIAVGACRAARLCYEDAMQYALRRRTFGKLLVQHDVILTKLADMARQVEQLQDQCDRVAHWITEGIPDSRMGEHCALLKVNASRTLEFCAREAAQIFGGAAIVKEGQGRRIERAYRSVRASAIPGGSEEILLLYAMRTAAKRAQKKLKAKL
jgi:alkylation response protein AidB-like acyl-CoA dehydrogenase